jgi:2-keto-4-pentenoate hydratase/2-oxohepta-3-ene-1,7-dioic acid hydratase in catechol pathway
VAVDDDLFFGVVEGVNDNDELTPDAMVALVHGHPFGELQATGRVLPAQDLRFVAPMLPSKIIAVARNYAEHAAEMGSDVPPQPVIFLKPNTSIIGPEDPIILPWQSEHVEHEAELAVIIGRMCRDVPLDRVSDVVFGYTCANDVTARDLQKVDGQWGRAKGFDSFCPLGPWIETDLDIDDVRIECAVNGETRQSGSTSAMVHDVAALVSWISSVMTLLPGDVILTGTPAGVGPIHAGDVVSVHIAGLGTLRNPVVDGE